MVNHHFLLLSTLMNKLKTFISLFVCLSTVYNKYPICTMSTGEIEHRREVFRIISIQSVIPCEGEEVVVERS